MSGFEANLEKKLQNVLNTQDSIQSLSMWVMHHRSQYSRIVNLWLKVLRKSKISHRLTLIYLANDVIQNSKRKAPHQPFLESFREAMKEAAVLSRDEKIRNSVERVFNIWEERNVYEADFIAELKEVLVNSKASVAAISEFECSKLTKQIALTEKLCNERIGKETTFNSKNHDFSRDQLLKKMKDKSHGHQYTKELDETVQQLEDIMAAHLEEKEARTALIQCLEQAEVYYSTVGKDFKGIANAYRSFGNRIQVVKTQLDAKLESSPPPSPPPTDAPSPTNSDEGPLLPNPAEDPGVKEEELEGPALLLPKLEGVDQPPSPGAVPSPEGSPVGFSPKKTASPTSVADGSPIQMASWMGSFAPQLSANKGSLESRLSTMRQAFDTNSGGSFLESQWPPSVAPPKPLLSHITNIISLTSSPRPEPVNPTQQSCLVTLAGSDSPLVHLPPESSSPSHSLSPPDPFRLKDWQAVPNLTTVPIDGATDLFSGKDMDYRNLNGTQNGDNYAPPTPPIAPPTYCSAPNPWKDIPPPPPVPPPPSVTPLSWNAPPPATPPPTTPPIRDWWPRAAPPPPRWTPYQRPPQPPRPY